jgi:hypothetical protein
VEQSRSGRAGSSSFTRTVAINVVILVVFVALLELGVRLFYDVSAHKPIGVHDVDHTNGIAFLPGSERVYETSEFRYTVRNNSYGRRDIEWTPSMLADPENILFIGDSMVLGNGVDHEWSVPTILERRIAKEGSPREVFNYGMPGGAPPRYKLLLEAAWQQAVAARIVLVGLTVGNDFYPGVLKPRATPQKPAGESRPRWYRRSHLLSFVELRVSNSARMVGWMLTVSRWLGIEAYDTPGSWIFLRRQTSEQEDLFLRVLSFIGQMDELCRANGRHLYVVIFPNKIQIENADDLTGAIYDARKPNRVILEYCEEKDLRCFDLSPRLTAEYARLGTPIYFPIDRHHNEKGNEIAAAAIFEFLAEYETGLRNPARNALDPPVGSPAAPESFRPRQGGSAAPPAARGR